MDVSKYLIFAAKISQDREISPLPRLNRSGELIGFGYFTGVRFGRSRW